MADYAALDGALEVMRDAGPELRNGLTNHAPMVVEALCAMNRPEAIATWLDHYRPGMEPRPRALEPIPHDWRRVLGLPERFTDWRELIAEELHEAPWRTVVDRWAARLAPGISAAATHGVIRTGHAVRALGQSETPARLAELADGLSYWAATYQTLPTRAAPHQTPLAPLAAIARVGIVPPERRIFAGTITSAFAALDESPDFAEAINLLDTRDDPAVVVSRLTETFARVYLANARDVLSAIVFIHGVTSAAAVRSMLPCLSPPTAQSALRHVWQTGCALYATFAVAAPDARIVEPCNDSSAALIDRAVANGDEHVIKFTETCLREDTIHPAPAYRAAAYHAATILAPLDLTRRS